MARYDSVKRIAIAASERRPHFTLAELLISRAPCEVWIVGYREVR